MTDTLDRAEQPETSIVSSTAPADTRSRGSRLLYAAAAWVGIAAGAVVIVGSIFMAGFILGHHGGGNGGGGRGHWHQISQNHHDGSRRGHQQWSPGPGSPAGGAATPGSGSAPSSGSAPGAPLPRP